MLTLATPAPSPQAGAPLSGAMYEADREAVKRISAAGGMGAPAVGHYRRRFCDPPPLGVLRPAQIAAMASSRRRTVAAMLRAQGADIFPLAANFAAFFP